MKILTLDIPERNGFKPKSIRVGRGGALIEYALNEEIQKVEIRMDTMKFDVNGDFPVLDHFDSDPALEEALLGAIPEISSVLSAHFRRLEPKLDQLLEQVFKEDPDEAYGIWLGALKRHLEATPEGKGNARQAITEFLNENELS